MRNVNLVVQTRCEVTGAGRARRERLRVKETGTQTTVKLLRQILKPIV